MLNELGKNWRITTKNQHTPLKAETPAEGETLQRLRGGGGEKSKRL